MIDVGKKCLGLGKPLMSSDGYHYFVQLINGAASDHVFRNKGSGASAAKKAYDKKKGGVQTIRLYKRGAKKQPGKGYRVYSYKVSSSMVSVPAASMPWMKAKGKGNVSVLKKKAVALPASYVAEIPR